MRRLFISMVLIVGLMITGCSLSRESIEKEEEEESKLVYCNDCGEESGEVTKYCPECGIEAKWVSEKVEIDEDDVVYEEETIVEEESVVKDEVYVEKSQFTESKALEIFTKHYGQPSEGNLYVPKGIHTENGKLYCLIVVGPPNAGGWSYKVFEDGVIVENIVMEDGEEIVH